ncbi:MAG: FAD-dependent oxidoreductase, partial [Cyanobacteria bacterium P01_A01_bin.105]
MTTTRTVQQSNGIFSESAFERPTAGASLTTSILVVGGSTAAYAATLTALKMNVSVCLVQPQKVLGGQFTAQALPASDDSHLLKTKASLMTVAGEDFGLSIAQQQFRQRQRQRQPVRGRVVSNPGGGWVGPIAVTPVTAATALNEPLIPYLRNGKLTLIPESDPVEVLQDTSNASRPRVTGVKFRHRPNGNLFSVSAPVTLEATDLGELLELADLPSRVGQESRSETGEAILPTVARPQCQQSFTFDALVERTQPGRGVPIGKPTDPSLLSWLNWHEFTSLFWVKRSQGWQKRDFFHPWGIFRYRRVLRHSLSESKVSVGDVAVINWGTSANPSDKQGFCGNDYRNGYLIGHGPEQRRQQIARGRDRTRAYIHYLQTQGGAADLKPRGDLTWTDDGIALEPYIREARRGVALTTIRHEDVAESFFPGQARSRCFSDSLGIGDYHYLDLHGNLVEGHVSPKGKDVIALPFTLPAGSLVPQSVDGLVLSAKSIGTTHITNAAYRMHPMEWAIGEASGFLAVYAIWTGQDVSTIVTTPAHLRKLQGFLTRNGIPIFWFDDVAHTDADFEPIQVMAAAAIVRSENQSNLHFRPHASVSRAVVSAAIVNLLELEKVAPARPSFSDVQPGRHWAYSAIETLKAQGIVAGLRGGRFAPDSPITRRQLGYIVQKAMPQAYVQAFARTPQDNRQLQRRELSRVLYEVMKARL